MSGSPPRDRRKQFATVALGKTRQNRRPSTVQLFANSSNPFSDAPSAGGSRDTDAPAATPSPVIRPAQRDDSALNKKSENADDNGAFDVGVIDNANGASPEANLMAQYRAREPMFKKDWSTQQPFQFGTAADVSAFNQGFPPRGGPGSEGGRLNPQEWEKKVASYNEWELGMLHKLALAAALLLTPDDGISNSESLDDRLDEIARGNSAVRAEPMPRRKSTGDSGEEKEKDMLQSPPDGNNVARNRSVSPRSPESNRKSQKYGSWTAKVAAAKKKSWERKKGADTLTQLRLEEGSANDETRILNPSPPEKDKSVFGIWNKDGSVATTNSPSPNSSALVTPVSSPLVNKKKDKEKEVPSTPDSVSASASNSATPVQTRKSNRFSSIRGKRSSQSAKQLMDAAANEEESETAFPGLSLRTSDRKEFLELKKANKQKEKEAPSAAFPGLSMRSADAKEFQELLKMDKQKKSESPPSQSSSPADHMLSRKSLSQSVSPRSPNSPTNSAETKPKTELGLKLSFLSSGRRGSVRETSSPLSSSVGGLSSSSNDIPQKSPKSNKRFSHVFTRSKDVGNTSSSIASSGSSSPRADQSPRRSLKLKQPSPRVLSPSVTTAGSAPGSGIFSRRKGVSPRAGNSELDVPVRPAVSSPPLSARELTADASTLAALTDLLGDDGVSPRPEDTEN